MNAKRMVATALMLAVAALSGAQGARQGKMGRMGGMGRNGFSEIQLATRRDVQDDLQVTDQQKTKLDELQEKNRSERRSNRQGGAGGGRMRGQGGQGQAGQGGSVDADAMRQRMQQMQEEQRKQLAEILNPQQMTRLGEIRLQLMGPRVLADKKYQADLGLSADQVSKIKELSTKQQEANREVRDKVEAGTLTGQQAMELVQKNQKILGEQYLKVLTSAQADKFKAMQGKPFKADEQPVG